MFQGEVVFTSPENRAGFVLVSTLERLPSSKTKSSNSEGVTILNIRHKQVFCYEICFFQCFMGSGICRIVIRSTIQCPVHST